MHRVAIGVSPRFCAIQMSQPLSLVFSVTSYSLWVARLQPIHARSNQDRVFRKQAVVTPLRRRTPPPASNGDRSPCSARVSLTEACRVPTTSVARAVPEGEQAVLVVSKLSCPSLCGQAVRHPPTAWRGSHPASSSHRLATCRCSP